MRLILLSYLVLPQTQGARLLYQTHINPFLAHHESDIDDLITHAHDRAKRAGLSSLKRFIEFLKENVLGMPPLQRSQSSASEPGRDGSYAETLLSRFNLPSSRQGIHASPGDFYSLLSAVLGQVGRNGASCEAQVKELNQSGMLIPKGLTSATEKMTFLATQQDRLRTLLTAIDREASELSNEEKIQKDVDMRLGSPITEEKLRRSKSEAEFEAIEKDELSGDRVSKTGGEGGSWIPWGLWGAKNDIVTKDFSKRSSTGADTRK